MNVVISALVPPGPHGYYTGGIVTIYVFLLVAGALSMTRSLPFGLMLGVSRRNYYPVCWWSRWASSTAWA